MAIEKHQVKASSHILNLLGSELIGSDSLAIFELVKNAYDADAENVVVCFEALNTPEQKIIITDDGSGMTSDVVSNVWLTIGTNYKRTEAKVSKLYNRVSLGNKGVGRLAVHRLAENIKLETQTQGDLFGSKLEINWRTLVASGDYIGDLTVDVEQGNIESFAKGHGTRITLTSLKTKKWTKANLRELARKIYNFKNPFDEIKNFNVEIDVQNEEYKGWIEDINTPTEILDKSLYYFKFKLSAGNEDTDNAKFEWEYSFRPTGLVDISSNQKTNINDGIKVLPISKRTVELFSENREQFVLKSTDLENLGDIEGVFYVFNLNGKLIDASYGFGKREAIKTYVKENCGVKIFRDNIRVYNYGEPSDDWLGLEFSKIQRAGDHFSKKVTIGAVSLDLASSSKGLVEKTNREGFSENDTYWLFREVVKEVFEFFERTADGDRQKIESTLSEATVNKRIGFSDTILELESKLKEKKLDNELRPLIKKVEADYTEMRDVMLNSGMTGLNLGLVFHEVEREMRFINSDLNTSSDIDVMLLKERVKSLMLLLENFGPILKQNSKSRLTARKIIERICQINYSRFKYHNIIVSTPILSNESPDFNIVGPGNLLLSSLSNIVDNAIYWVSLQRELTGSEYKSAIYIGTDIELYESPAIIIADNGPGFQLDPDIMVQPYKTTRPGGMGLGLYFVNLVLETMGGKLLFPDNKDLNIPGVYNGACIALVFPN